MQIRDYRFAHLHQISAKWTNIFSLLELGLVRVVPISWIQLTRAIDSDISDPTVYIDLKSMVLVDVLRPVLKDVRTASLEGKNPTVYSCNICP
jgi:hypothetical protein